MPEGLELSDRLAEQIRTLIRIALQTGDASAFEGALFSMTLEKPELAASIAAFTTSAISEQVAVNAKQASASTEQTAVGTEQTSEGAEQIPGSLEQVSISAVPAVEISTANLVKSLTIAATVGPAAAAPTKFKEIMAATTAVIAAIESSAPAEQITLDAVTVDETAAVDEAAAASQEALTELIAKSVESKLIVIYDDPDISLENFDAASGGETEAPALPDIATVPGDGSEEQSFFSPPVEPPSSGSASPTG